MAAARPGIPQTKPHGGEPWEHTLTLRLGEDLYRALAKESAHEHTSINQFVAGVLRDRMDERAKAKRLAER